MDYVIVTMNILNKACKNARTFSMLAHILCQSGNDDKNKDKWFNKIQIIFAIKYDIIINNQVNEFFYFI